MEENKIIGLVHLYVLNLLSDNLPEGMYFHNINHTQEVVSAALEIADACHCTPMQLEVIILAAWFHDSGYIKAYVNHEDFSKAIAEDFLEKQNYPEEMVGQVLTCIEATRFPQNPKSPEANILADADMYHFTKPDYPSYEQRLRKEFANQLNKVYKDSEWDKINYNLLRNHAYFTPYGRDVLQKFKELNIERLEKKLM
ncbi:MAG: HD domain-containing protein [Chitinophagaceae bacterium]|nr:HD domain-containing protein [Chitinophagaceae bacterium]